MRFIGTANRARISAQAIYTVMLLIAAIGLAIAAAFPAIEYFTLYSKPAPYYKWDPNARLPQPPAVAAPAPAPAPAPALAPAENPGQTAPEPVKESAPAPAG